MQSEKKYNSKAAPEYKKHIQKLLHELSGSNLASRSRSDDANDPKGLDGLISSLAATSTSAAAPATTTPPPVLSAAVPMPETVFRSTSATVTPKGTLNISAAASTDNLAGAGGTPPPAEATPTGSVATEAPVAESTAAADANAAGADALRLLKLGAKKPPAKKAGMGAKKLVTSSSADVRMESFEQVEKRTTVAAQEVEDRKLAAALQAQENASSGRVAAMMTDADGAGKTSLYRSTSNTSSTASLGGSSTGSSRYQTGTSGASAAPSTYRNSPARPASNAKGPESFAARDKYSGQKGISSDQFFGRDEEDAANARARLGQLQGSTSISSDMIYRNRQESEDDDGSATLEKLKDSVAGFFESFGK
jgi:ADP-ribosylation factor GTPase-activating protein 2/3